MQHKERLATGRPATAASLRGTMGLGVKFEDDEGMNQFIPGFNESSPRSRSQLVSDYLANELH